ncbi:MAG TPA: hypothetical protein VIQ74_11895, partial [Gemmatimonadaceae bacterium]
MSNRTGCGWVTATSTREQASRSRQIHVAIARSSVRSRQHVRYHAPSQQELPHVAQQLLDRQRDEEHRD